MFDSLSQKLNKVFRDLRGFGRLSETNIKDALREIKLALLEADVNYKVVKDFIDSIKDKAIGKDVLDSITPGQQVVKIVYDEMVVLMGGDKPFVPETKKNNNRIMLVGLQGSGKTTTTAKMAEYYRKKGYNPYLVPLDIRRPAAVEQLVFLGKQLNIPVHPVGQEKNVVKIAQKAMEAAWKTENSLIIFDTAGRLHIDQELMDELLELKKIIQPQAIYLVADSMTGQDAVNSVVSFNEKLSLTGVVLTKLDGDARGGAALSIRATTGTPIVFIGVGEKIQDFELFHGDRMASRILGMGDVISLVERAQNQFDEQQMVDFEQKIKKNEINLVDFLNQLKQFRKLGPLEKILEMIPGMNNLKGLNLDEKQILYIEAIILSMTIKERLKPEIIDASRKKRIAKGSGTSVQEVNQLLNKFFMMKKMMKDIMKQKNKFTKMGGKLWR